MPSPIISQMVAALAGSGRLDISSPVDMREALWVMMTQVPAISSAAFATFDLKLVRVARRPDGQVIRDTISLADLPRGLERFRELQTSHVTFWGALFWSEVLQQPVLNVRTPIRRIDDAFIGGLMATVALGDLSLLIGEASQDSGGRYFILVGRDTGAGASPPGRSARPRPQRRPRAADHQGGRRSRAGADLVAADPQPADRPRRWAMSAMSSRPRGDAGCSSIASSRATARSPGWSGNTFRWRTPPATSTG